MTAGIPGKYLRTTKVPLAPQQMYFPASQDDPPCFYTPPPTELPTTDMALVPTSSNTPHSPGPPQVPIMTDGIPLINDHHQSLPLQFTLSTHMTVGSCATPRPLVVSHMYHSHPSDDPRVMCGEVFGSALGSLGF